MPTLDNYLGVRPVYMRLYTVLGGAEPMELHVSHASSALLCVSTEICVGGAVNSIHAWRWGGVSDKKRTTS